MSYDTEVLADSPRAYWKLDETSGSSFADSSGNSQTLSLTGAGISYSQSPIAPGINNGIALTAATTYLSKTDSASSPLDVGDVWTLEAWVYPSSISGASWANVIDKGSAYAMGFYRQTGGGYTQGEVIGVRSQVAVLTKSNPNYLAINNPYHLVVVKNGSTRQIYINGVSVGVNVTASTCVNNNQKINIGNAAGFESSSYQYLGKISNVAVYGTALSPTRIQAHYDAATIVDPGASIDVNYAQNVKASLDCNLTSLTGTEDVELEYGTSSGVYTHSIPLTATNGTQTKILTGLSEGTTYYARVNIDNTYFSTEEDFTTTEFTVLDAETGYVGQTVAFAKWEIDNIYDETVAIVLTDLDDGSSSDEIPWSLNNGWNTKKLTGLDYYTNYKAELKINGVIR